MAYKVKIAAFEGPFDLLLHLVSRQRLDVNSVSIVEVTDQYLEHVERMQEFDLDVASDFLLVAATLLEIKAASLIPTEGEVYVGDEIDDLSPEDAREILVARLLSYKQFKNVALEFNARMESVARMHPRQAGIEEGFLHLVPDYLEGVTLHGLAVVCADLLYRREVFLLAAEHVSSIPIPLELHAKSLIRRLVRERMVSFNRLLKSAEITPELVVVTFLAVLELYKLGIAEVRQDDLFEDITITLLDPEAADRPLDIEEDR